MMQPLDHGVSLDSPPGFLEAAIVTGVLVLLGVIGYVIWRRRTA